MKQSVITLCAALVAAVAFATPHAQSKGGISLTPEERELLKGNATGGVIVLPTEGKVLRIVNAANAPDEAMRGIARTLEQALQYQTEVVTGTPCPNEALAGNAGFALIVIDKADAPAILAANDDGWVQLNVAPLKTDDPARYAERIQKNAWRALSYGLGGGNSLFEKCIAKPVMSADELDKNPALMACPEVYPRMDMTCKKLGLGHKRQVTYFQACREGWAPAPTNKVQKLIWEKFKTEANAKPSNPMKITKEK